MGVEVSQPFPDPEDLFPEARGLDRVELAQGRQHPIQELTDLLTPGPDSLVRQLWWAGLGTVQANEQQQQAILDWAMDLFYQLSAQ